MHIQDVRVEGWWPLQHHDPSKSVVDRATMGAVRIHPVDDPLLPEPARQTYGDIQGGLFWESAGDKRNYLHSWWLTGPGVLSQDGGGPNSFEALTAAVEGRPLDHGGWLPHRRQIAGELEADDRYRRMEPARPFWAADAKFPKGHPGLLSAGTEEFSQHELLHPSFYGLFAVNKAGDPACGTLVYDLDSEGVPDRSARLQSAWSVVLLNEPADTHGEAKDYSNPYAPSAQGSGEIGGTRTRDGSVGGTQTRGGGSGGGTQTRGGGSTQTRSQPSGSIAWQLGRGGNLDGGMGHGLVVDYTADEIGFAAARKGGPWLTGGEKGCTRHNLTTDVDGRPVRPVHMNPFVPWILDQTRDGPLAFETRFYNESASDFPHPTAAHLRYSQAAQAWRIESSSPFYLPPQIPDRPAEGSTNPPPDGTQTRPRTGSDTYGRNPDGTIPLVGSEVKPAYPTSTNCIVVPNVILKATATRQGVFDPTGSAVPLTEEQLKQFESAPQVAHLAVLAPGDGSWDGFEVYALNDERGHAKASGTVLVLPADVTAAQVADGSVPPTQGGITLGLVPGLARLSLATVKNGRPQSGVVLSGTVDGQLTATVYEDGVVTSSTNLLSGGGGGSLPAGAVNHVLWHDGQDWVASSDPVVNTLHVTGKLTVDGLLDPTALVLTPQSLIPSGADWGTVGTLWADTEFRAPRWWDGQGNSLYLAYWGQSWHLAYNGLTWHEHGSHSTTNTVHVFRKRIDAGGPAPVNGIGLRLDLNVPRATQRDDELVGSLEARWTDVASSKGALRLAIPVGPALELHAGDAVARVTGAYLEIPSRSTPAALVTTGTSLLYTRSSDGVLCVFDARGEVALGGGGSLPLTTLGDIAYHNGSAIARLAGNTTTTRKFLRQTGDGVNSAAPAWDTLTAADVPDLSATYALAGHDHDADYQPLDSDLTTIAALTHTARGFLVSDGANWTRRAIEAADLPDLSATYAVIGHDHDSVYQPLDAQLSDFAALSYAGNAGRMLAVNATETGLEWVAPSGGAADHGDLTGLTDDDHPQYALADGTRGSFASLTHDHDGTYQPLDAALTALSGTTPAADRLPYFDSGTTAALTTLTAAGRALLDDADAATQRTTLGLGTIATQDANNVAITGGSVTGITDLAVADGGTGASTAADARANLGVPPTTRAINTTAPLTGGGDLSADRTIALAAQAANTVLAGPTSGAPAAPTARALVADDIPALDAAKITSGTLDAARIPTLDPSKLSTSGASEGDVVTIVGGVPTWQAPSGGGGPPSVDTWGAESRYGASAMTGNLTLVDGDDTVQLLDPLGAARTVTLPAPTTSSKFFLLTVLGGSFGSVTVYDHAGKTLATLTADEAAWCWTDGTYWIATTFTTASSSRIDTVGELYRYAGDPDANDAYLLSNWTSRMDSTTITTPQPYRNEHVVARDGLASFAIVLTSASASGTFDFYRNGADAGDIPFTTSASTSTNYAVVAISVSVSAGDELTVRSPSAQPFDCEVLINVSQSATAGVTLGCWAGNCSSSSTSDQYLRIGAASSDSTSTVSNAATSVTVPSACAFGKLAYGTQNGDTTTEINVYVNGASDQSFTLAAAQGLQTLAATALSAGDEVEVLYEGTDTGGTSPRASQIQIEVTGFNQGGALYLWGRTNDITSVSAYLRPWWTRGTDTSTLGFETAVVMALPGSCHYAGQSGGSMGVPFALYKNGASSEQFGGTPGAAESLSTTYAAGDELAVRNPGPFSTSNPVNVLIHMG